MSPKYSEKDLISLGWHLRKGLRQRYPRLHLNLLAMCKISAIKTIGCVPIPYFCYALSTK